jgi:hypothetical protein
MGVALTCGPLGAGALAAGLVSASFNAAAGFDTTAGVGAAVVFSLAFATTGADEAGAGLAAAANGFSTAGGGGDGGVGWEDEAAGVGATEVGTAAGASPNLSLYFGLSPASSATEAAGLVGTTGGFSATGEGGDGGDGEAGAADADASAGRSSRNFSL